MECLPWRTHVAVSVIRDTIISTQAVMELAELAQVVHTPQEGLHQAVLAVHRIVVQEPSPPAVHAMGAI
jgi:hypothetical protein